MDTFTANHPEKPVPPAEKPATRAGRFVVARYPVPPALADLVAQLAGLGADR